MNNELVPADVRKALDRMCTPLDQSVLKGATAEADARSMQIIRGYIERQAALAQQQEDYEELQHQYHLLASEMVYEGNSVQHWRQKALAYKECAGVIYELKSLLGVETPADVLEQVKTQQQEAEPYGYLRENDGAVQLSIGSERPPDRSGGYSTPWAAIYSRPPKPAAQPQVPEGYALTPIEPADGLLISMACRDRHDFGLLSRGMQESIMGSMRQVHEEVVGAGFYNPDKEAEYKSMLSAAKDGGGWK